MSRGEHPTRTSESTVPLVKGTADVLPDTYCRLDGLRRNLLGSFGRAGYRPIDVPVLEGRELHERKSGARIVANLYRVSGGLSEEVCLRPEVTAGIVRAYCDAPGPLPLPWRVSYAGPVFRVLPTGPGVLREFHQVGVERLDDLGVGGDAEVIWLADWSLRRVGIDDATIRIGHAGLIRDLLQWSGLPRGVQVALVEVLGEAAQAGGSATSEDRVLTAMEAHLEALAAWLGTGEDDGETPIPAEDGGADRLFRNLYPQVVGRRSGREIIGRIRRKWDLGHGLAGVLATVRERVRELADLRGPALDVLDRLRRFDDAVPSLRNELTALVQDLRAYGIDPGRVELDLGFGRGIGFYTQMMFVVLAGTPDGPREVCGGGRYDGLARALGSPRDVRGVGFAFGLERLRDVLGAQGLDRAHLNLGVARTLILARSPEAFGLAVRLRDALGTVVVESAEIDARAARDRGFLRLVEVHGPSIRQTDLKTGLVTESASLDDILSQLGPLDDPD